MSFNWRNPKYTFDGSVMIDCEIEHPEFGWIPFTCNPNDPSTADLHAEIVAAGGIAAGDPLPGGIADLNDGYV